VKVGNELIHSKCKEFNDFMKESYIVESERDDLKLKLNKSNDEKHRLE